MPLRNRRVVAELQAQHLALRAMMDRCEELAEQLELGRCGPLQLTREVTRLRMAFEAHNSFEEKLLRPLLQEVDPFAAARIDRMIEDHVNEHRAMNLQLGTTETRDLREVVETLRAHLDAEERYLLTARILREETPSEPT